MKVEAAGKAASRAEVLVVYDIVEYNGVSTTAMLLAESKQNSVFSHLAAFYPDTNSVVLVS